MSLWPGPPVKVGSSSPVTLAYWRPVPAYILRLSHPLTPALLPLSSSNYDSCTLITTYPPSALKLITDVFRTTEIEFQSTYLCP